jgi:hypothetical protein
MVKAEPGAIVKLPDPSTQTKALIASFFLMDFAAAPVLAPVFPVTANSVLPAAQRVPPFGVPVTPVTLVVPVPFHVIVPEPDVRAATGKVPLVPVLGLSEHFETVPVVPPMFPAIFLQVTAGTAFCAADAVPANPIATAEAGSAQMATMEIMRRMYFPLTRGKLPLLWIDSSSQASIWVQVKLL